MNNTEDCGREFLGHQLQDFDVATEASRSVCSSDNVDCAAGRPVGI